MPDPEIRPAAEFQALPLETIVGAPLIAAVKAQAVAAEATKNFIEQFIDENGKPETVTFEVVQKDEGGDMQVSIAAPLLSMIPVPHLRIDSLTTRFKFELSQSIVDKQASEYGVQISAKTGGLLSPWVSASLKGSISRTSEEETTVNRSGSIDITVQASEAPIPEGLERILSLLAKSIDTKTD